MPILGIIASSQFIAQNLIVDTLLVAGGGGSGFNISGGGGAG